MKNYSFCKETLDSEDELQINKFPSLKAQIYTVFYKFYTDQRKPILSDVFDIIISSLIPYVEVFLTESHQKEVINKIKKNDPFIDGLEVYSINEF